jgi:putative chitinase
MITVERLIAAGLSPTAAKTFAVPLQAACERYAILTPNRIGGLIGQLMIESAGFTRLEENLFSTTSARLRAVWPSRFGPGKHDPALYVRNPQRLANLVYAGKIGNGDVLSGDGWRYRGRGLKQLTGRGNYEEARVRIGVDYVGQPDLVAQPQHAALTAAWFFARHSCNPLADEGQWDAITRKVNGPAMLQASQRRAATLKAVRAFR